MVFSLPTSDSSRRRVTIARAPAPRAASLAARGREEVATSLYRDESPRLGLGPGRGLGCPFEGFVPWNRPGWRGLDHRTQPRQEIDGPTFGPVIPPGWAGRGGLLEPRRSRSTEQPPEADRRRPEHTADEVLDTLTAAGVEAEGRKSSINWLNFRRGGAVEPVGLNELKSVLDCWPDTRAKSRPFLPSTLR